MGRNIRVHCMKKLMKK